MQSEQKRNDRQRQHEIVEKCYWFVNLEPEENCLNEQGYNPQKGHDENKVAIEEASDPFEGQDLKHKRDNPIHEDHKDDEEEVGNQRKDQSEQYHYHQEDDCKYRQHS